MSSLYTLKHTQQALSFEIKQSTTLIGRSANCAIQIDSETLSREHARLLIQGQQLVIHDLHSTNGTFVNDRQINEPCVLQAGDIVRFGQESFALHSAERDATVMFSRKQLESGTAMLVADDEEENGTMMMQSIALPAGWQSTDNTSMHGLITEHDQALIEALQQNALKKLKHAQGLLVTISSDGKVPSVKLFSSDQEEARWLIGRSAKAAIELQDSRVSEKHAHILFKNKQWLMQDNNSRNGTFVGKRKLSAETIKQTVNLSIGPYQLHCDVIKR